MASLAACSWHKPLPLVPCLSWSTASGVFTQGVLSGAINWERLKNQYFSDQVFRDELFNMINSPEGHFRVYHEVGQQFAREFPESLAHVEKLRSEDTLEKDHINVGESKNHQNICDRTETEKVSYPLKFLKKFHMFKSADGKKNKPDPSLLLKYGEDKRNISNPYQSLHPVTIRPATAKDKPPITFQPYLTIKDSLTWEAVQFMRGIMDECTHLANFSIPVDPSLIIIVAANNDGYMPRDNIIPLTELWPGSELRTLNTGHITAFLFNQQMFRKAIKDAFERAIKKYYSDKIPIHFHNLEMKNHIQSSAAQNLC